MLPRLYNPTDNFDYNGLGFFTAVNSCAAKEDTSGTYTLDLTISNQDRLAAFAVPDMFVKALTNFRDPPQLFEITDVAVSPNGQERRITAQHIKTLAFQDCLRDTFIARAFNDRTADYVGKEYFSYHRSQTNRFSFSSDIPGVKSFDCFDAKSKLFGDLFGQAEGGIQAIYGGEFHYNNFEIELLSHRGRGMHRITYGGALSDYEQSLTNGASYTHLIGYVKVPLANVQGEHLVITGDPYRTDKTRAFFKPKMLDFTSDLLEDYGDVKIDGNFPDGSGNTPPYLTKTKIIERIADYTDWYFRKNVKYQGTNAAQVSLTIDYQPALDSMKDLGLCDPITVVLSPGNSVVSTITSVTFDSINERFVEIGVGAPRLTLADFIRDKRQ